MLSQVKRKKNLFLALTLTVLITGSILAFSIQAAYSTEELFGAYNFLLSGSNAQTAIEQVQKELKGIQDDARIEGDETLAISIDNVVIKLDVAKKGLAEMDKFFFVMSDELHSLKQGLKSDSNEVAVESMKQTTESATMESDSVTNKTNEIERRELTISLLDEEHNPQSIKPKVPNWIKSNAGWYAEGLITEVDFVKGLEWMINNGVIEIQDQEEIVK